MTAGTEEIRVSVVIVTYNSAHFLRESIDSILQQEEENFECIVVDDGSTDHTGEVLSSYQDARLRSYTMPVNCGIGTARNLGLCLARGKYLAVMDADDIAFPERLRLQAQFLDQHPEVDILGARTIRIIQSGDQEIDRPLHPLEDGLIKARLLLLNGTAMIHPASMMRMAFLKANNLAYLSRRRSVDHALWIKCVAAGVRFQALPELLLKKRRHDGNVTRANDARSEALKTPLRVELIGMYFPSLTNHEARSLALLMQGGARLSAGQIQAGLSAGSRALVETESYFGESKMHLRKIVGAFLRLAQQ